MISRIASRQLYVRFVDEVLNGGSVSAAEEVFSASFRDWDPIGPQTARGVSWRAYAGLAEFKLLVHTLRHPTVKMIFSSEECIVQDNTLAYRLIGEGTISLPVSSNPGPRQQHVSKPKEPQNRPGASLSTERVRRDVRYRCTGMFRVDDGVFVERWGVQKLA